MEARRRRIALRALLVLAISAPIASVATPAQAAGGVSLPFSTFFRMTVDDAHDQVFVSGGQGTGVLARFDLDGNPLSSVSMQGAAGMAWVGPNLYVAEADAPDIAILDPSVDPPVIVDRLDVGAFTQPHDLAYVAGRLWFFTPSGLVTMAPDGSDLQGPYTWGNLDSPSFAEGSHGEIDFDSGGTFFRVTATVPPVVITSSWQASSSSIAVVPGGASMIAAGSYNEGASETRLCDLAELRAYATPSSTSAVTITTAHGGLLAAGGWDSFGNATGDITVARLGLAPSIFTYDFADQYDQVVANGLEWSSDGDRLFAITKTYSTDPALQIVDPTGLPTMSWPTLTVDPSATSIDLGSTIDITVHLTGGDTNHTVKLYSQPQGGTRTLIGSGAVDGAGDLTVSGYAPPWSTTLTAVYAGDAGWGIANTATDVSVRSTTTVELKHSLGTKGGSTLYPRGSDVPFMAHLAPANGSGKGTALVQHNTGSGWKKVWSWTTNYTPEGRFVDSVTSLRPGGRYRIRVTSPGTSAYLGSASEWVSFRFTTG